MGQPVTTNPFVIMLINMTVVFAVLWGLSWVIRLIKIIDPTQKKNVNVPEAAEIPKAEENIPAVTSDEETFILIAAALSAYGYSPTDIVAIRPVGGKMWTQTARIEGVQARNPMF